jgi:hypothetical protein
MPRPRRPYSAHTLVEEFHTPYLQDTGIKLGSRQRQRWEISSHAGYATENGCEDPLTYMLIIDALMNIDPFIELRAKNLVIFLNDRYQQMIFDAVTVGKALNDLCDSHEGLAGKGNGFLERGRDHNGHFYLIHQNPETAKVIFALRDDLQRLFMNEKAERKNGMRPRFRGSPLLECVSMRGAWNSPLRSE